MANGIITLTTDFGPGSEYVGALKAVILSVNTDARIVDLAHDIPPQDIRRAAYVLADVAMRFPVGTTHLAVVDPGVGTQRRIVFARFGSQNFVAPDNGLLGCLAGHSDPRLVVAVTDSSYWLDEVSATFHGRDIMAPVAAHLSMGLAPQRLGPQQQGVARVPWPEVRVLAKQIRGEVVSVDAFGNLRTNITEEMLQGVPRDESLIVQCDEHETMGLFSTYADQPEMTLIALIGSSGFLELAIVNDSAATMLGVREGAGVTVRWENGAEEKQNG